MPTGARPVGDLTSQLSRTYVTPLPGPTRYRTALMSGELQEDEGPMSALELSNKTNENTAEIRSLRDDNSLLRKDMESVELTVDALHGQIETTMNDSLTSHATRHDQQHITLLEKMDRLMERSPGTPSPTVPRPPVLGSGIQAVLSPAKRHQSLDTWGSNWINSPTVRSNWPDDLVFDSGFMTAVANRKKQDGKQTTPVHTGHGFTENFTANPGATARHPEIDTGKSADTPVRDSTRRRAVKVEASAPSRFSRVSIDTDIEDWLGQVLDNCNFGLLDPDSWVLYATGYLDGQPRLEWQEYRKQARLSGKPDETMKWDHFVAWCRKHLTLLNRKKLAFDKLKTFKQTGSVAKYVSTFNLLCMQAKVTDEHKLHYWYDGLRSDIKAKTEYDPVTKLGFASIEDAQSAALAIDSFHTSSGTAGNNSLATGSYSNRKRGTFTPATTGFDNEMQLDAPPPAKRFTLSRDTGPREQKKLSRPQPQNSGFVYFPLEGTALSKDAPDAIRPILERLKSRQSKLPEHLLIPEQTLPDGRRQRPANTCWIKGCGQGHNYISCPCFLNYLQEHPNMDAPMPNNWVRPAPHNNNRNNAHRR